MAEGAFGTGVLPDTIRSTPTSVLPRDSEELADFTASPARAPDTDGQYVPGSGTFSIGSVRNKESGALLPTRDQW